MKNKKYKINKIVIAINILIEILYLILSKILLYNEIYFRKVVMDFMYLNRLILIIILIRLVVKIILKRYKEIVFKQVLSLISVIVLSLYIVFIMLMSYAFSVKEEAFAYRQGKEYIAVSEPYGFHHTNIVFYEYINPVMMKTSNIDGFMYDGSFNCYKYNDSKYLKTPYIDLYSEFEFRQLNPWHAKEKFSSKGFKYLGNQTYDFGKLIIKFDDAESIIKEAFIKGDIVTYKGESIIGKNINTIKKHIEDINNGLEIKINYTELRDESNNEGIRVIREDNYGTNYPALLFIVDDKNIIKEVRYFNN